MITQVQPGSEGPADTVIICRPRKGGSYVWIREGKKGGPYMSRGQAENGAKKHNPDVDPWAFVHRPDPK